MGIAPVGVCSWEMEITSFERGTHIQASAHFVTQLDHLNRCFRMQLQGVADAAVEHANTLNRRTLDVLAARTAFYLSLSHERLGTLASLRPRLLSLHATAVLNHDDVGQEVLLNLLLRNYLHYNLYDQAEKLRAQAQRPEAPRSNQQYCRYLYFLGRIRAVQLEYSEAKECLQQAARKVCYRLVVVLAVALCLHTGYDTLRTSTVSPLCAQRLTFCTAYQAF